jgi:hypothetical protein
MNMISIADRRIGTGNRRVVPVPPAPSPSSDIIWSCDFTKPLASYGWTEQSKVPGRATPVTVGGRTAIRLHTESGDNNVNGSGDWERDDLQLNQTFNEGDEVWWAHSVLFPDDYVDPPESVAGGIWNGGVVFDLHNSNPGGGQANFMVLAMPVAAIAPDRPTGLSFQVSYGAQTTPTVVNYPIGPIARNIWYDFEYHLLATSGPTGYFDAWVGGVQKMSYKGPTLYPGQAVYPKLAHYHSAYGKASSVLHSHVLRGKTQQSVS